jgi:hypothetical protein
MSGTPIVVVAPAAARHEASSVNCVIDADAPADHTPATARPRAV